MLLLHAQALKILLKKENTGYRILKTLHQMELGWEFGELDKYFQMITGL